MSPHFLSVFSVLRALHTRSNWISTTRWRTDVWRTSTQRGQVTCHVPTVNRGKELSLGLHWFTRMPLQERKKERNRRVSKSSEHCVGCAWSCNDAVRGSREKPSQSIEEWHVEPRKDRKVWWTSKNSSIWIFGYSKGGWRGKAGSKLER